MMKKVNSIEEVSINSYIMFLDDDGSIRGIDLVKKINKEDGAYEYETTEGKTYQGWLGKYLNQFNGYIVDKSYLSYKDEDLRDAFLRIDDVFENMYGETMGSFIRNHCVKDVSKDFSKRREFIDFVREYETELYNIRWEGDEEVGVAPEVLLRDKNNVQRALNQATFLKE